MKPRVARAASMLACTALLLGSSRLSPSSLARHEFEKPAAPPVEAGPSVGERWLETARTALAEATRVEVPFVERGRVEGVDAAAAAFEFEAVGGQTLEITLAREAAGAGREGQVYLEVFRVIDVLGQRLHQRLAALDAHAAALKTRLPRDGAYHVLVQTDATGAGAYRLTVELAAALPFPVVGADARAIRSYFGASRDSGRRAHQGVDVYVQRLTPVLAVAAGRAMPRHDALGGNTVWLNTPGTSYYYAHLDRVAVREQQRVKAGDVLGYVGNSGNASGMPSHLHFGVYRWGRDPVDPLPLIVGQRFTEEPAPAGSADAGG